MSEWVRERQWKKTQKLKFFCKKKIPLVCVSIISFDSNFRHKTHTHTNTYINSLIISSVNDVDDDSHRISFYHWKQQKNIFFFGNISSFIKHHTNHLALIYFHILWMNEWINFSVFTLANNTQKDQNKKKYINPKKKIEWFEKTLTNMECFFLVVRIFFFTYINQPCTNAICIRMERLKKKSMNFR